MIFAVVDVETTGMDPARDRIIEIGIVLMRGRRIGRRFCSLVNPGLRLSRWISELTGIDPVALSGAPSFEDVAASVQAMIGEADYFVAHNARFDYGFVKAEFGRMGQEFHKKSLCTIRLGRKIFPEVGRYNLDRMIEHFELTCKNRHRALDDALAAAELLRRYQRRRTAWNSAIVAENPPTGSELARLLRIERKPRRPSRDFAFVLAPNRRGYERPEVVDRTTPGAFGPFRTNVGYRTYLQALVLAHNLCAKILGLGPCVRKCAGACEGMEAADAHNARLRRALQAMRIEAETPSRFAVLEPLEDGRRELFVFEPPFLVRQQVIDEGIDEIPFDGALPSRPLDGSAWRAIRKHVERHPDRVIRRD